MKSPFIHQRHARPQGLDRLQLIWVIVASVILSLGPTLTHWHWMSLTSPLAPICTWSLLQRPWIYSLAITLIISSLLDTIVGQPILRVISCHVLATTLTRLLYLPINLPFHWLIGLHLAIWSFIFQLFWQGLAPDHEMRSILSIINLYVLPLQALKDGLLCTFFIGIPLYFLTHKKSNPSYT